MRVENFPMLTVLVLKLTWESISLLCVHNQDQLFQSNMEPPYMGIACGNLLLLYIIIYYLYLFIKCDKEGYTGDAVNTTCYYDIKTDFQYSFRMKEDIDK